MLWQTLQKDLYYPLVADKNSYNSGNFEARSLKFGMVVDLDNTQSQKDDNDDENDDKYDNDDEEDDEDQNGHNLANF